MNDSKAKEDTSPGVWSLTGNSPEEAAELQQRSDLLVGILLQAKQKGLSQGAVASKGKMTFAENLSLYRGEVDQLSLERLKAISETLGMDADFMAKMKRRLV